MPPVIGVTSVETTPPILRRQEADGRVLIYLDPTATLPADGTGTNTNTPGVTDAAGFDLICEEVNAYGVRTGRYLKREKHADDSFRCVPWDPCCLPTWWCVNNAWLSLTAACCPSNFNVTRIVRLTFTAKTGAAADLPDVAYWANAAGTLTFTGRTPGKLTFACAADPYGYYSTSVSDGGGVEYGGGYLTASLSDGFSGHAPVVAPCTLTASPLDLGTWTYTRTRTDECGNTVTETGTVAVTVASWIDGSANPISGVQSLTEGQSPAPMPWMTGPYKTQAIASKCCVALVCANTTCPVQVRRPFQIDLRNPTGVFTGAAGTGVSAGPAAPSYVVFPPVDSTTDCTISRFVTFGVGSDYIAQGGGGGGGPLHLAVYWTLTVTPTSIAEVFGVSQYIDEPLAASQLVGDFSVGGPRYPTLASAGSISAGLATATRSTTPVPCNDLLHPAGTYVGTYRLSWFATPIGTVELWVH